MAEDLIRKQRHLFVGILDADNVADYLCQQEIISSGELGNLNNTDDLGKEKRTLLKLITKCPWVDGVQFAKILSVIEVNHEVRRVLLCNAGRWVKLLVCARNFIACSCSDFFIFLHSLSCAQDERRVMLLYLFALCVRGGGL